METLKYTERNRIMYYVSDVYRATRRFRPGDPAALAGRIRTAAVSISAGLNVLSLEGPENNTEKIYAVISAVSVLETYLQLARQYRLLKDDSLLNGELAELKRMLMRMNGRM